MKHINVVFVITIALFIWMAGCQAENRADNGDDNGGAVPQDNPIPTLSSMTPTAIVTHMPDFSLEVTGSDFVNGAKIIFNGAELDTTYISSTQLSCTVSSTAATMASSNRDSLYTSQKETVTVRVRNPAPGGGDSGALDFTIYDNFVFDSTASLSTPGRDAYHAKIHVTADGRVDVSWHEDRGLDSRHSYMRHSADGGQTWQAIRAVHTQKSSTNPALCRDANDTLHCVFDYTSIAPYSVLRHTTSDDNGATWSEPTTVPDSRVSTAILPLLIAGEGQALHLVYRGHEISTIRSLDAGKTWGPRVQISNGFYRPSDMDACRDDQGNLFVLWEQPRGRDSEDRRLWFSRSLDRGISWLAPQIIRVFKTLNWANHVSLAAGTNQHLTAAWSVYNWTGYGDEFYVETVFANKSGNVWSARKRMHAENISAGSAELCADAAGNIHLFLTDDEKQPLQYQLRFHRSTDNGASWSRPVFVKQVNRKSLDPAAACDAAGNVYLVFTDKLNGRNTVFFTRSRIPDP